MEHVFLQRSLSITALSAMLWLPTSAYAQDFSLSPTLSTLGAGLEAGVKLTDKLALRATWNIAAYSGDGEIEDVDYDVDADLHSFGLIGDLHPFGNGFRVSAGVRYNLNGADIEGTPTDPVTIGDTTYSPTQIGTLEGDVDFNQFAPYIGVGFDNALFGSGTISFKADLGLHYQGDPDVELRAREGTLAADPVFQADIEHERQRIEDDLEILGFYPVVSIGLSIRF